MSTLDAWCRWQGGTINGIARSAADVVSHRDIMPSGLASPFPRGVPFGPARTLRMPSNSHPAPLYQFYTSMPCGTSLLERAWWLLLLLLHPIAGAAAILDSNAATMARRHMAFAASRAACCCSASVGESASRWRLTSPRDVAK